MSSGTKTKITPAFPSGRTASASQKPSLWGLLPGILAASVVVLFGGIYALIQLLNPSPLFGGESGSPGSGLVQALADPVLRDSILFSIRVGFYSTIVSILLGTVLSIWIWSQPPGFPGYFYTLPLIFPHIVAGFFVIVFFSRSGIISSLLVQLGAIADLDEFPTMVFDNQGIGIILGYIYKETAFVILVLLAALRKIDPRLITNARMLGASRFRQFKSVIFPAIRPSLAVASIIIFLYSFGAFDIPFLLGSSSRPMASVLSYRLFFEGDLADRPRALAMLVIIWVISLGFLLINYVLQEAYSRQRGTRPDSGLMG